MGFKKRQFFKKQDGSWYEIINMRNSEGNYVTYFNLTLPEEITQYNKQINNG